MAGEKSRVLLVDDDPIFGKKALAQLRAAEIDARFHRGPLGTLQAVRDSDCELVVLDVNMPKVDGMLLARMIRDAFGLGHTRIILCSDAAPEFLATLARALQVQSVAKSEGWEALIESVRAGLRSPRRSASVPVARRRPSEGRRSART
jgi:CheY-like chemotaxis protein